MTYTNLWTLNHPAVGTNQARDLDDAIRQLRLDFQERLLTVTGEASLSDPVSAESLKSLRALADTKPSINPTNDRIPFRSGAGVLGDSSINDDGNNATARGSFTVTNQFTNTGSPRCIALSGAGTLTVPGVISFAASETFDVGSMHSTSADQSKIVVPVGAGGTYLFFAHLFPNGANWNNHSIYFRKNGTTQVGPAFTSPSADAVSSECYTIIHLIVLAASDYIEVYFASGGNIPLNPCYITAARMF